MLNLIAPDQQYYLRIVPDAPGLINVVPNLDVFASWNDIQMPTLALPQPGNIAFCINMPTLYSLGGAPAETYIRQYKSIYVMNLAIGFDTDVFVMLRKGDMYFNIKKYTLATSEHFSYIEGIGFIKYDNDGTPVSMV